LLACSTLVVRPDAICKRRSNRINGRKPDPRGKGSKLPALLASFTDVFLFRKIDAFFLRRWHVSAFRKEFRKWQATAPANPAEFAASEFYWQYKASIA
jgi:hypothetical protein